MYARQRVYGGLAEASRQCTINFLHISALLVIQIDYQLVTYNANTIFDTIDCCCYLSH